MSSWLLPIKQTLASLPDQPPRVAVVGVGHDLNGDDAAGLAVARALRRRLADQDRLVVIEAGIAPENCTGALRVFRPHLVLLVDAAQMGDPPGSVRWVPWQDTTGVSATTHTLPLYMLGKFLAADLGCDVALLGLQPFANEFDTPLSSGMQTVIDSVVNDLHAVLSAV